MRMTLFLLFFLFCDVKVAVQQFFFVVRQNLICLGRTGITQGIHTKTLICYIVNYTPTFMSDAVFLATREYTALYIYLFLGLYKHNMVLSMIFFIFIRLDYYFVHCALFRSEYSLLP